MPAAPRASTGRGWSGVSTLQPQCDPSAHKVAIALTAATTMPGALVEVGVEVGVGPESSCSTAGLAVRPAGRSTCRAVTGVPRPHHGAVTVSGAPTTDARPPHRVFPTSGRRVVGIDVARGVALISMFVAHTAPTAGPGGVLMLSEYLTFPLFALLVGAGAALGVRVRTPLEHLLHTLVQAAALLGLGWALQQAGAHVVIVLAQLGVLTLVAWGLVRLPAWAVATVGVLAGAAAGWTLAVTDEKAREVALASEGERWLFELLFSHFYPQAVLISMACVGIVVVRLLVPGDGVRVRWSWAVGLGALAVAAVMAVADATGRIELVAYETVPLVQVFVLLLSVSVVTLCLALGTVAVAPVRVVARELARMGAMTLTLYSLHVLWLALWATHLRPLESDNAWVNVVGLSLGAWIVALVWTSLPWPPAWRRGPLEGVVAQITRWVGLLRR